MINVNNIISLLFCISFPIYSYQKRPNVLFIIVDDLRPALGTYGDPNSYTPNLDKLAGNSFVFKNTFAQQALCAPSRNSFLTSRRPDSLHLYDFYSYWRDTVGNFTTMPQHFKENDYITHSIGKVFHAGESSNNNDDAPFSWSLPPFHPKTNKYKDAPVCLTRTGERKSNLLCPVLVEDQPLGTLPDLEITQKAIEFLRNYNMNETEKEHFDESKDCENIIDEKKPYFLAIGFHKPHVPFKFPRDYLKFHPLSEIQLPSNHYRPALLPTVAWAHWADVRQREDIAALNLSFPYGAMPENTMRQITQHYSAAVSYIDDMVGGVLKAALGEKWGENDETGSGNTIVVLTADHGWSLGEHGEFAKYSNFEVATKVPLIIYVPGLTNGETVYVNDLTELVDLFPTLVDLTHISESLKTCPINQTRDDFILCTEGQSLVPLMISNIVRGKKMNYKISSNVKLAVFSQYPRYSTNPTLKPNNDKPRLKNINIMGYSIRTNIHRYTEWVEFDNKKLQPDWNQVVGKELYDHTIDPGENMNLIDRSEMQDLINKLKKQLKKGWRHVC